MPLGNLKATPSFLTLIASARTSSKVKDLSFYCPPSILQTPSIIPRRLALISFDIICTSASILFKFFVASVSPSLQLLFPLCSRKMTLLSDLQGPCYSPVGSFKAIKRHLKFRSQKYGRTSSILIICLQSRQNSKYLQNALNFS